MSRTEEHAKKAGVFEVSQLPTIEANPTGLHQRYTVTKSNGEPVDPNAVYFVLRLDSGGRDWPHIGACREAAKAYADAVFHEPGSEGKHLHEMARQLGDLVERLERETHR